MPDDEQNQTDNPNPEGEELDRFRARVAELERLIADKDEELAARNARIAELEQLVASKDSEIISLRQAIVESDEKFTQVSSSLAQAVASYRALVVQSNPGILEELIAGDTIEEIDHSLENAKNLISKVRQELEEEASKARVPAGAPQRTAPDLSALSPREKIQYAIKRSP